MSQPRTAYRMQRKVFGWMCIGTSNLLEQVIDGQMTTDTNALLNDRELKVWGNAHNDLVSCEKRLRALGKHLLKEQYGGH